MASLEEAGSPVSLQDVSANQGKRTTTIEWSMQATTPIRSMPLNDFRKTLSSVSLPVPQEKRIPMARRGDRWLISVDNVEEGRGLAERIDSALVRAHSFHERDAVAESDPVDARELVHVVTEAPRSAVETILKEKKRNAI